MHFFTPPAAPAVLPVAAPPASLLPPRPSAPPPFSPRASAALPPNADDIFGGLKAVLERSKKRPAVDFSDYTPMAAVAAPDSQGGLLRSAKRAKPTLPAPEATPAPPMCSPVQHALLRPSSGGDVTETASRIIRTLQSLTPELSSLAQTPATYLLSPPPVVPPHSPPGVAREGPPAPPSAWASFEMAPLATAPRGATFTAPVGPAMGPPPVAPATAPVASAGASFAAPAPGWDGAFLATNAANAGKAAAAAAAEAKGKPATVAPAAVGEVAPAAAAVGGGWDAAFLAKNAVDVKKAQDAAAAEAAKGTPSAPAAVAAPKASMPGAFTFCLPASAAVAPTPTPPPVSPPPPVIHAQEQDQELPEVVPQFLFAANPRAVELPLEPLGRVYRFRTPEPLRQAPQPRAGTPRATALAAYKFSHAGRPL